MHSAVLRSGDFELFVKGSPQNHEDFFKGWSNTRRLGFVAENGLEGIGSGDGTCHCILQHIPSN